MGQLGVTGAGVAGAAGAAAFGIPPQIGYLAGTLIGNLLFGGDNKPKTNGTQQKITTSLYGETIRYGFGHARIGGNMFWHGGFTKHSPDSGDDWLKAIAGGVAMLGKSGKDGGDTYTWTGGILLGEGPIQDIVRVWADSKLVYDKTGQSGQLFRGQSYGLQGDLFTKGGSKFRIYLGTEEQLPDPAIEAKEGVGLVSGMRGMAYVVFENFPIQDYGNRIPQFSFEVCWAANEASLGIAGTELVENEGDATNDQGLAIDWDRDRFFIVVNSSDPAVGGIRAFRLSTCTEYAKVTLAGLGHPDDGSISSIHLDQDGYLYAEFGIANSVPIVKIEPDALVPIATFGIYSADLANYSTHFSYVAHWTDLRVLSQGAVEDYVVTGGLFGQAGLLFTSGGGMQYTSGHYINWTGYDLLNRITLCPGIAAEGYGMAWGCTTPVTPVTDFVSLVSMTVGAGAWAVHTDPNPLVSMALTAQIAPAAIDASWIQIDGLSAMIYDASNDRLLMMFTGSDGVTATHKLVSIDPYSGTVVWSTTVASFPIYVDQLSMSRVINSYSWIAGAVIYTADTETGEVTTQAAPSDQNDVQVREFGTQSYEVGNQQIVVLTQAGPVALILLNRASGADVPLSDAIAAVCQRVSLTPDDLDVSALESTVLKGYVIDQQQSAADVIGPLSTAFLFNVVESDWKLKFVPRGGASVADIGPDDLLQSSGDDGLPSSFKETRQQEVELPRTVTVNYIDMDSDYDQNSKGWQRPRSPVPSVFSDNDLVIQLPIVLDGDEARTLAQVLNYSAWQSRVTGQFQTHWGFLALDPTDVVTVTLKDGSVYKLLVQQLDFGANFVLDYQGVSEDSITYTGDAQAADGGFGQDQGLGGLGAPRLMWFDVPLLKDIYDKGQGTTAPLVAVGQYIERAYPGASVYRSSDGAGFQAVASLGAEPVWGIAVTALDDVAEPFQTDHTNSVTVKLVHGSLSGITTLAMLNGANAAVMANVSTGELEVFQFRDVVDNGDGTWTLSTLLRGRRGTEVYTGAHAVGEVFLLLRTDGSSRLAAMGAGEANLVRAYKAVFPGQSLAEAPGVNYTSTARDLKPYAPVHYAAALSGSDIALSWQRRTRIGGQLQNFTGDVPLSEQSEAFEIDIYDGDDVIRTLTATGVSVTYEAADIAADFGSAPSTLKLAVYQISAAVGRGFGRAQTVTVTS